MTTYKSLRSFSVFVRVAIQHITRSDKIYHKAVSIKTNTDILTAINTTKFYQYFPYITHFGRADHPQARPNHKAYTVEINKTLCG
jgi:hypothetical protein